MSRLRFTISMSLDGFVAGPRQSVKDPLGIGGEQLHEWVTGLASWREAHGLPGGEVNENTRVIDEAVTNIGATIMGRNMFGGHPGSWEAREEPWNGGWDDDPPFHHPVFVLTHYPRPPLAMKGGTTFHFVTSGIEEALTRAREAARGKDITLAGGASAAQQYLKAGLVDEMELHVVPVLLGSGERLFEGTGRELHGLRPVRTLATREVTHLKFARPRAG